MTDIAIIGAGPAGLTAAIYALRAGHTATLFDKGLYGGQTAITSEVENYPGINKISGPDFATQMYQQAQSLGADFIFEEVHEILPGTPNTLMTAAGKHQAGAVILATGAQRRKLGCPGEERLAGRGVSYCATCDGAFFRGREVAVVGGGNTALEDALFLASNCKKVYLIHRRDTFRGEHALQDAVKEKDNIQILYQHIVERIEGEEAVTSLLLRDMSTNRTKELPVSGVFVAIGLIPDTGLVKGLLPVDPGGYLLIDESCSTPIAGLFVAGDNRAKPLRQIVTATADGAVAAWQAANYLNTQNRKAR